MSRRTGTTSGTARYHGPTVSAEPSSGAGPAPNHAKQHETMTQTDWPLRSYLELGALPSAVPCARLHAKHVLWEWGLEQFSETVELVVSELTTNAQQASAVLTISRYDGRWIPGVPPIRLWLYSDKERVLVQVWDADDHLPEPQSIDLEAESGRGLLLVEALCADWGAYVPGGWSGKVVWGCCHP